MQHCKVNYHTYNSHSIHYGVCVRCGYTAEDACEFDFIRSWHDRMGQQAVTAEDLTKQVNLRHLPNVLKNKAPATLDAVEKLLKALVGGKVVTGTDNIIVEIAAMDNGSYRAIETDNPFVAMPTA